MSKTWELLEGNTDQFALKLSFSEDPGRIPEISQEVALSWGSFEFWVGGRNLCLHQEAGTTRNSVHWYLLTLLEWLAESWDPLFHEERLPCENRAPGAWESLFETFSAPPAKRERETFSWESDWYAWWSRHSLLAARDGGLFPDVVIRRWRDLIEISWGRTRVAGTPRHYQFLQVPDVVRLEPNIVVEPLFSVVSKAASVLLEQAPTNARLKKLAGILDSLRSTKKHREVRLALLAGLGPTVEKCVSSWDSIQRILAKTPAPAKKAIFDVERGHKELVQKGSCHAALMFGSASPRLSQKDKLALANELVSRFDEGGDPSTLSSYLPNKPLPVSFKHAWGQGYELAEDLLQTLQPGFRSSAGYTEIEKFVRGLGIETDEIALDDHETRGISLAGPRHRPTILVNNQNANNASSEGRRFTLAHELCHLLYDRDYGKRLALCSGPWAPVDVERRANAFAAMVLMPTDAVTRVIAKSRMGPESPDTVKHVASVFKTSITSTIEHLYNLHFYTESSRDTLRAVLQYRPRE